VASLLPLHNFYSILIRLLDPSGLLIFLINSINIVIQFGHERKSEVTVLLTAGKMKHRI
jgi:hypothetical protein